MFVNVASWIEIVGKGIKVEVGEGEKTGCGAGTVSDGGIGEAVKVGVKTPGIVGEIRGVIGVQVAEGAAVWEPVGVTVIVLVASGVSEGVSEPGVIDPVGETVIVWVVVRVLLEVILGVRVAVSCCKAILLRFCESADDGDSGYASVCTWTLARFMHAMNTNMSRNPNLLGGTRNRMGAGSAGARPLGMEGIISTASHDIIFLIRFILKSVFTLQLGLLALGVNSFAFPDLPAQAPRTSFMTAVMTNLDAMQVLSLHFIG